MDCLILLDLLGAENPSMMSFYPSTNWLHEGLRAVEKRLGEEGLFANLGAPGWVGATWGKGGKGMPWFKPPGYGWGGISDDHLPFLHRGVEVLHCMSNAGDFLFTNLGILILSSTLVIPNPFPPVWHTLKVRPNLLLSICSSFMRVS
jgi:glutaminyl-peptide cyclotransferase